MSTYTGDQRKATPATVIRVLALIVAMLLVSAATLQRSQSAFSGETKYGTDATAGSATVKLTSTSASKFDVQDLVPGDTMTRCVDVAYEGTARPAQLDSVRMFMNDQAVGPLADHLTVMAQLGEAGTTCASSAVNPATIATSSRLSDVYRDHSGYASAYDTGWSPAAGESRPFWFTVTLPAETSNEAQGLTASPIITWEIRSKPGTER